MRAALPGFGRNGRVEPLKADGDSGAIDSVLALVSVVYGFDPARVW